ncbi:MULTISPECIES: TetR family transcriptional regulator [unclassified Rhizobium]|uniref:TetR family transcriptional regulator n=1 Tax=unclassified Rhizobium TaxID=2613769 RepID=UPI00161DD087|nr:MULTISPECIES: TetR family transcriptional regulator [unclassified Rhizobium]MBB3289399.1 TetR/AcrR family acrAB operon transcriptional repressor [Rhizobium sp. BK252]MBB3404201.1 TetR/AcrR family acrAB operon transcriptional repressor [Rhizobium sp. BK289]MBB3416726.1 TetR/AcrR family acrAB operon transcriptional repressor [Rhizobium sp. BK284]MBB3484604.1 TetR/AcrR family acrAB operon transcriptional repressor [Rhizobium sp. BK347]MDK4721181.1 TetR family transcriptional regulator [Rhizobi
MRRTKEEAAETRSEILHSAKALFLDKGYENVSLEEIAAAAGVTRGAVHWHFKNKQGLMFAIRDEAQQPFQELAERMSKELPTNPLDLVAEAIAGIFDDVQGDPRKRSMLKVMMHLDMAFCDGTTNRASSFRHDMHEHFERIFTLMNEKTKLPAPWTPDTAASALTAVIGGLITEWTLDRGNFQLVPCGQMFIKMILKTWFPQERTHEVETSAA